MAGRDFKIKPVTRFVNGPDRMTAEWPLQGNSCMQDCQIPGGRARRTRAGAPLAPCAWLLGALQPPLFYCSFSMKERNLFFCLGQGNNKRWLKRRLASEATGSPKCHGSTWWQTESMVEAVWEEWAWLRMDIAHTSGARDGPSSVRLPKVNISQRNGTEPNKGKKNKPRHCKNRVKEGVWAEAIAALTLLG